MSTAVLPTQDSAKPVSHSLTSGRPSYVHVLIGIFLALGVGVRLFHFFHNRSFFIDEIYLNVNTIKMGFWALATEPFEYQQKAPLGYLWVSKLCVLLFGKQEMALRLFPLLCGLGTLAVFATVARHFLNGWGAAVAIGVMALSTPCIYHSVEAKQYSTELLMAASALLFYIWFHNRPTLVGLLTWGMLGAVALWFSFSAIFVLASIGVVVTARHLLAGQWRKLFLYLVPFTLWLVSFSVQYYFVLSKYPQSGWLIDFFDKVYHGFMPFPPTSVADALWYVQKPYTLLVHPLGILLHLDGDWTHLQYTQWRHVFKMGWLPAGLLLGGMRVAYLRNPTLFFCLLLPLLLVFLASGARVYPFYGRFLLFLAPALLLFLGYGVEALQELLHRRRLLFYATVALLFFPLFINTGRQLTTTDLFMNREFNREPFFYVNQHYQPGDAVYVFWNMTHAYQYYREAYALKYEAIQGSDLKNTASGPDDFRRQMQLELNKLKGKKRVWFVFDYTNRNAIGEYVDQPQWYQDKGFAPTTEMQNLLDQMGRKVTELHSKPYLYYPHTAVLYELHQ